MTKTISDLLEIGKPDNIDRQTLIAVLNFWEEVAIGVFSHEANEGIVKDFFNTMVLRTFMVSQSWIGRQRLEKNYPTAYIQFENLYNRWKPR